jgi:hypothetical protein
MISAKLCRYQCSCPLNWSPCCWKFPFFNSKPSSLNSPKLIRPLPILPLPILIAHLQRATRSLISANSAAISEVMSSCISNEEAIAKLARDPEDVSNGLGYAECTNSCARMHLTLLFPGSQRTRPLLWHTLSRQPGLQDDFRLYRGLLLQ